MDNDGVFQGGTAKIVTNGSQYLFDKFNAEYRSDAEPLPHLPADFIPRQYVDKEYAEHLANHEIEDCFCHNGEHVRISQHLGDRFTDELFGVNTHYEAPFSTPDDFPYEPYAVEGGHEFLKYLNAREVPWALVSNGYSNFAIRFWKDAGLLAHRQTAPIVFPENLNSLEESKPSPRHLETALEQLNIQDDEEITLFMVGDSMGSDMTATYRLAKRHPSYEVHAIYFTKEHPETKDTSKDIAKLESWAQEQPNLNVTVCHTFEQVKAYVDTLPS
jgi:phosphoglycolate phosphatase-like HAD superfamily hydrolase